MTVTTLFVTALLVLLAALFPDGEEEHRIALTIYSKADPARFNPQVDASPGRPDLRSFPGFGVIRERRSVAMENGVNTLRFTGVAAGIDPTTVSFRSLTAPDSTTVLEQSFEYDLVNSFRLFDRSLDRPITIHRETPNGVRSSLTAPLLAHEVFSRDSGRLVLGGNEEGDPIRIIPLDANIAEIELPDTGAGLTTKPTLSWLVSADTPGEHDVELSYQTGGLTWRADYNLIVNPEKTSADLSAWVSILNQSGASYENARLKLIAGDVQQVEPQPMMGGFLGGMGGMGGATREPEFEQRPFFEYHLYTLDRTTSLPDRSTKQIELFPRRSDVNVDPVYVYFGAPPDFHSWFYDEVETDRTLGTDANTQVDVYLRLTNDEDHGLGLPLPTGRVRVYQRDEADGAPEFVGEHVIDHTPDGEEILARVGSAFDLVGDRTQFDYQRKGDREISETFEISVRNRKDEPVEVIVREVLYRWLNWEITGCSHEYTKEDSRTIHIPVTIPAGGEETVVYTVHYTFEPQRGGFR